MYPQLIELQKCVIIKHIGVSNFNIKQIEMLIETYGNIPYMNQVELHLRNQKTELIEYCKSKNIIVQAHSLICSKPDNFERSWCETSLRWIYSKSLQCVVGTVNHMIENLGTYGSTRDLTYLDDGYCKFKRF